MSDSPPDILIITADDSTVARCSGWIADLPCRVVLQTDSNPRDPAPCNVGVIRIDHTDMSEQSDCGDPGPGADVRLPTDVSRRELRTVCRLLLEIVRLRRSLQSADRLGQRFKKASLTDPLTELANRRDWQAMLESRLDQVSQNRPLCLAVIDLDHFKRVNSSHGHAIGDQVLKRVAAAIGCSLREDDYVARLGGDEFGLLFWAPSPQIATEIVNRVRAAIGRLCVDELLTDEVDENGGNITASAGFCIATHSISPEELYSNADAAMRKAKRTGRNRTVAFS